MIPLNWLEECRWPRKANNFTGSFELKTHFTYRVATTPEYSGPVLRRPLSPKVTCIIKPDFKCAKIYISSLEKGWAYMRGNTETGKFLLL